MPDDNPAIIKYPEPIERHCPHCQAMHARLLAFNTALALVDYFRCPACRYVWNEPKPGANPCGGQNSRR